MISTHLPARFLHHAPPRLVTLTPPQRLRHRCDDDRGLRAVITFDAEGICTGWSHCAEILFGFTEAECLGRRIGTMLSPEGTENDRYVAFLKLMAAGRQSVFITNNRRKDGDEVEVMWMFAPTANPAGTVTGARFIGSASAAKGRVLRIA